jgi:repressor LexA
MTNPWKQELDPLTERQEEILRYIARHIDLNGFQPSIRELGERFRIRSPNGVVGHLKAMERKGYLSLNSMTARGISFMWKEWV